MEPHQERVVKEKEELDEKIVKLAAFIDSGKKPYQDLPLDEKGRLILQLSIMQHYSYILNERITAFPKA